jgi:hypothetical protein
MFVYLFENMWYSMTLTTRRRVHIEKLIVPKLVTQFTALVWNPTVHFRDYKFSPLDHIQSQINLVIVSNAILFT